MRRSYEKRPRSTPSTGTNKINDLRRSKAIPQQAYECAAGAQRPVHALTRGLVVRDWWKCLKRVVTSKVEVRIGWHPFRDEGGVSFRTRGPRPSRGLISHVSGLLVHCCREPIGPRNLHVKARSVQPPSNCNRAVDRGTLDKRCEVMARMMEDNVSSFPGVRRRVKVRVYYD